MDNRDGRIQAIWQRNSGAALSILDRVRECAALTKPWILPPIGQNETQSLPQSFQGLGARGTTNLVGKYLYATYPYGLPWLELDLSPEIQYNPKISADFKNEAADKMFWIEVIVQASIEGAGQRLVSRSNDVRGGFMSSQRRMMDQLVVTGDALERMADDFRTTVFRRDQYVTHRDGAGNVMYHVIKERIDPLTLTDEEISRVGLNKDDIDSEAMDLRMVDKYTYVYWQPRTKKWLIESEINGKPLYAAPAEETVTPYFSTCYELAPGENYGRGFIEGNLPDLRTLDEGEMHLIDFGGICSKMYPVIDYNSLVQEEDLERPNGTPLKCKVDAGGAQDVGFLKANNYPDFKVVYDTVVRKRTDLGKAMLLDSEVIPSKERTTATQVRQIAQELDAATGGASTQIMDDSTIPRVKRAIHILMRDGKIPLLPDGAANISIKTGPASLARQNRLGNIVSFVTMAQQLGQDAMSSINMDVLLDVARRYLNISEPTIIKTAAEKQADQQRAAQAQLSEAVTNKAADVVGNVAQGALTNALAA